MVPGFEVWSLCDPGDTAGAYLISKVIITLGVPRFIKPLQLGPDKCQSMCLSLSLVESTPLFGGWCQGQERRFAQRC